jgi:gluconolactonase
MNANDTQARQYARPAAANWSRRSLLVAGAGLVAACAHDSAPPTSPHPPGATLGGVRRIDAALDAIVPAGAQVEELGSGYQWAEGPVWVRKGGYLLFSDVPGNTIYRWSAKRGAETFMHPSGYAGQDTAQLREAGSNGLALDAKGRLLMCDSGSRGLARMDLSSRRKEIFLNRYQGKRFNSPNDLAVARSGAIYFTDPPYGLAGLNKSPLKELKFNGVYRRAPDGRVSVVDDTLTFPNGIALSPDESVLYVSNSDPDRPIIRAYALGADGMPKSTSTFFDASRLKAADAPGVPDGMAIDAAGRLFATGPGGVMILTPDTRLLGVIGAGRAIANCKFGEDGHTLFLTAHDKLARIRLTVLGHGWGA